MRCLIAKISAFLFFIPVVTFANWQVAKPDSATASPSADPFFQGHTSQYSLPNSTVIATYRSPPTSYKKSNYKGYPNKSYAYRNTRYVSKSPVYAISVSGSLKDNIERIMDRYHWRVVWKAPFDYNFDGRVTGTSLPNVMEKLLQPFPLQAVMYISNRTMAVIPRAI